MFQFSLNKKTGFKNMKLDEPVIINDFRGIEFYNSNYANKPVDAFNLPVGEYSVISGEFMPIKNPVNFAKNTLSMRERLFRPYASGFKIKFIPNKHKAFISWPDRTIIIDPSLKNKTLAELFYILFHEYAHRVYKTESKTDALAENMMINHGFNPSQIHRALITVLSEKQQQRKNDTVERAHSK